MCVAPNKIPFCSFSAMQDFLKDLNQVTKYVLSLFLIKVLVKGKDFETINMERTYLNVSFFKFLKTVSQSAIFET